MGWVTMDEPEHEGDPLSDPHADDNATRISTIVIYDFTSLHSYSFLPRTTMMVPLASLSSPRKSLGMPEQKIWMGKP